MKAKKGAVPKLRFPEFREAGEWRVIPLGNLLLRHPEYGINAPAVPYSEQLPTYLRITDIDENGRFSSEDKCSVNASVNEGSYLADGDIVLARTGASVGKSYRYRVQDGRLVFAGFLIRVRPDDKKLISKLLANYLTTAFFWKWVRVTSARSGQPGINGNEYATLPVPVPFSDTEEYGLAEQQKIADCLTSLDELIAAQGRKVEALKAYKHGLMQQLFPREGETVPRLRFPEFRDAEGWASRPFEHFVIRSFYGTSSSTSETGQYPVLRMGNMVDGNLKFTNLVYLNLDQKSFEDMRLVKGDILLNRTNSPDLVGKIAIFDRDMDCITASYIVTYRVDTERLDPVFCNAMLNSQQYQKKIKMFARPSVSQANINPTTFKKELILAVPSPAEQHRIASSLSSLDTQIAAESNKLAVLKADKQALMQQLFPAMAED